MAVDDLTKASVPWRPFHLMTKPIGPACNLRCDYCFYLEKERLFPASERFRMRDDVLGSYILQYLESQLGPELQFAWQGGEPTLMGLDFFRKIVKLQRKHAQGRMIHNSLQTNGTLLDDEWCDFLAKEKFLVGLSLDGPRHIHDRHRVKADGSGSFDEVMRGLRLLKKHRVEFNSLTCVSAASAGHGREIYRFLRKQGIKYMQFIPIVERVPGVRATELGLDADVPPYPGDEPRNTAVQPYTVKPEDYGALLVDIFKTWIKKDVGRIYVNHFDLALSAWVGQEPPLCVYARQCGDALALEHDGSVYSCDHYVYPTYRLGNIMEQSLAGLVGSEKQRAFGEDKETSLPEYCRECRYLFACNGDCPKHRFSNAPDGKPGLSYLCAGLKRFFSYADPYLTRMAELHKSERPAADIMSERPPMRGVSR